MVAISPGAYSQIDTDTDAFLQRHWERPIPAQGPPPADFSAREASLAPEACGHCHVQQFRDWRTSLHSQSMGDGVLWQLRSMPQAAANECMDCHAPLAEQKSLLALEQQWPNVPRTSPPGYVGTQLHQQGLVCAGCHVRTHVHWGPPPPVAGQAPSAHGGFRSHRAFGDSRFCAVCHQFPPDGRRLNGKLLENTFTEWSASAHARADRQCQDCHMPGQRHLWRGIHDPDMVREALSVELDVERSDAEGLVIRATLANTGAGHHFPTYAVAEVIATLTLTAPSRAPRELLRYRIARRTDLALTREIADTRIPAGEQVVLEHVVPAHTPPGTSVELVLTVAPRALYERQFRQVLDEHPGFSQAALLANALDAAVGARFVAVRLRQPVPVSDPSAPTTLQIAPQSDATDVLQPAFR